MKRLLSTIVFAISSFIAMGQYGPISSNPNSDESNDRESSSQSQNTDFNNRTFGQRLMYGGSASLSFGTTTYIELSPRVGYRVTENLTSGIGVNYIYYNSSYYNYETSIYGGNVFSTYNLPIGLPLALHGEFEMLNFEYQYETRDWVPGLNLGAALFQPISSRGGGVYFMVLYNVLYDPARSYYGSPWVFRLNFML